MMESLQNLTNSSALQSERTTALHSTKERKDYHHKRERRDKVHHTKSSTHPILHPDVEHAQTEDCRVFRFSEDSRPMFSPVPRISSLDEDSEDSDRPVPHSKPTKEKTTFPAIHIEQCEKRQPPRVSIVSKQTSAHSSPCHTNESLSTLSGSGSLNVPSPYLHRKSDGRLVLMTQDSNRGLLGSWSHSEGNLPEAVRKSHSSPGSNNHLLDIRYRPSWHTGPALHPSSDLTLHDLRRNTTQSTPSSRRLPSRLEPLSGLSVAHRAVSAGDVQFP